MVAKRLLGESAEQDIDQLEPRRTRRRPSFPTVIREAMLAKSIRSFCVALEPMLRRVVNEEVEKGFTRGAQQLVLYRSPSLQIQAQEPSSFTLYFAEKLSLPIFTGSKIQDQNKNPLQLILVDSRGNERTPTTLPHSIKLEIVVINGEFGGEDCEDWSNEYFDSKIVRERRGKRPLIIGEVGVTMRGGYVSIGNLAFSDNSSWIRSRTFRLGARVAPESLSSCGVRIREAITEPFGVKDHRGELYKKHYPPSLNDEVWRLENIGKNGVFHGKLIMEGIRTVQDFLKLWVIDPTRLRAVLGIGMSDRAFELTMKHAKDCVLDNKQYILRGPCYSVILNPICQVVGLTLDGMSYSMSNLLGVHKEYVENLVKDAYENWNSLEVIDSFISENYQPEIGDKTPTGQ